MVIAGFAQLLFGCAPVMLQQGAKPLGKGKTVVGVSTNVMHFQSVEDKPQTSTVINGAAGYVRHGFTDRLDGGISLEPGAMRLDGKIGILTGGTLTFAVDGGLNLAVSTSHDKPAGSSSSTQDTTSTGLDLAAIIGIEAGGGELYVAPRYGQFGSDNKLTGSPTTHVWYHAWGAAVGLAFPLKPGVKLVPELGVYRYEEHTGGHRAFSQDLFTPSIGIQAGF